MVASGSGATPEPAEQGPRLTPDRIVERLVPDPSRPEPRVSLTGLLGRSTEEGVWRLYLTSGIEEYAEFAESDVVHTESVPEGMLPTGGTTVWLRMGATVRHPTVSSRQVQAEFLQGALAARFLPGAGLAGALTPAGAVGTGAACTRNYVCSINPHIPACQIHTENCGTGACGDTGAFCPTGAFIEGC